MTVAPNYTLAVSGATVVDGTLILAGTGAKTFTGALTIDPGGTYNETGIAAVTNSNNITNNGAYIANAGTHTFSSATAKTIGGANVISIPTVSITGGSISGALNVPTALTIGAAVTNNGTIITHRSHSTIPLPQWHVAYLHHPGRRKYLDQRGHRRSELRWGQHCCNADGNSRRQRGQLQRRRANR